MKILIDTQNKTLKLEESVEFKKLAKFVKENKMEDWQILPVRKIHRPGDIQIYTTDYNS